MKLPINPSGFLGDLLSDPEIMAQVGPLLGAAIDERIEPLVERVEQLAQGVTLIAQGMVEQAQQQPQMPQQPAQQPQQQFVPGVGPDPRLIGQQTAGLQNGISPTPPQFGQQAAASNPMDKFASLAPLLMQYLSNQQSGNGNLGNVAETLSAAAQIGNVMNQPMWQGMRMATDMMSLAGRAGIEPTVAAETLGRMVTDATPAQSSANGTDPSG
jgi:hypothetical protein